MKTTITIFFAGIFLLNANAQLITQTGNFSVKRVDHSSELLNNGKVLAFGGNNGDGTSYQVHSSSELYSSGSWTSTGSMNKMRNDPSSVLLTDGNVIVIGGIDDSFNEHITCEIYNVAAGTWSYTDSMTTARSEFKAILLDNGKILAVGGKYTSTCELYDLNTKTWSVTGSLSFSRTGGFDATKLPNGNVLVTGGGTTTAEIYDVTSGTWTNVPNAMIESRSASSAILMANGKVLVTGGDFKKTSEVFDPVTNTFTAAGEMINYASLCKMINLTNGNVLIYGIGDLFSVDKKALQVFNPVSNTWTSAGKVGLDIYSASRYTVHRLSSGKILYAGGNWTTGNGANRECYLVDENSISVGIDKKENYSLFEVYPNPSNNIITVKVDNSMQVPNYSITDKLGRIVKKGILINESSDININELSPGFYLFQIGDQNVKSIKIIKK